MKKLFYLLMISAFAMSCSNGGSTETENNDSASEETTQQEEQASEEKVKEEPEVVTKPFTGKWKFFDNKSKLTVLLDLNEDGTYWQELAGREAKGTWEELENNQIKITNENLKNGQTWTITKAEGDDLWIIWNPDSKDPKELQFKRRE